MFVSGTAQIIKSTYKILILFFHFLIVNCHAILVESKDNNNDNKKKEAYSESIRKGKKNFTG